MDIDNATKSTDFSDKKKYVYVRESVLRFFLNTYKLQLGAAEHEIGKFILVGSQSEGQYETYELQVIRDGKWMSRRMGIAPLGDGTGSKSKCFKVFYDDILVVKIPPSPIKDFEKYIDGINAERRIVGHLKPDIECIFPSVSAILRKIPPFSSEQDIFPEEIEKKSIEMLREEPRFQEYLKIGDTFAFFMSLSKHSFFSSVMEKMHDRKTRFREEVTEQFDILWDAVAFEEIYGADKISLFFAISDIYTAYENKLNYLARKYEIVGIPIYKKKEWFLIHLAEIGYEKEEKLIPAEFAREIRYIFENMSTEEKKTAEQYRKTIAEYIHHRSFEQNKTGARRIISNILTLMAALNRKGVAIRDLKPDNIFIIGDLRSAEFSMGLIDFETSVVFKPKKNEEILQSMLAGTPSYATPSHLFRNETLTETLKDLPGVLHHQDRYAMIVMIYHAVTGDRLFEETRKMLPKIGKIIYSPLPEGTTLPKLFKYCSRTFWQNAKAEFERKTELNRRMLEDVEVQIPEEVKIIFLKEIHKSEADLAAWTRNHIRSQNIFKSEKSRNDLITASHKIIRQCRTNWERGVNVPKSEPAIRLRIISFMQKLEELKFQSDKICRYKEILSKDSPQMSVYDILNFMFGVTTDIMCKTEWESLEDMTGADSDIAVQVSYDKTISVEEIPSEETMSYERTVPEEEK